jgi:hypothetical protein
MLNCQVNVNRSQDFRKCIHVRCVTRPPPRWDGASRVEELKLRRNALANGRHRADDHFKGARALATGMPGCAAADHGWEVRLTRRPSGVGVLCLWQSRPPLTTKIEPRNTRHASLFGLVRNCRNLFPSRSLWFVNLDSAPWAADAAILPGVRTRRMMGILEAYLKRGGFDYATENAKAPEEGSTGCGSRRRVHGAGRWCIRNGSRWTYIE